MKLSHNITGKSINEIELALNAFMDEVRNKKLESNCFWPLNDENNTQIDYSFSNGNDVFKDNKHAITVYPYK
jgi:hypothetical protein